MTEYLITLLAKRGYDKLQSGARDMEFFVKVITGEERDEVKMCLLVNAQSGMRITGDQLEGLAYQLERDLLLKGYRNIEIMYLILSDNPSRQQSLTEKKINCWIIDTENRKLIIYDNQPENYEAMKDAIEYELQYSDTMKLANVKRMKNIPYITIILIAINCVVFYFTYMKSGMYGDWSERYANAWQLTFDLEEYYRLFTCMFLHYGFNHLVSNMFVLGILGWKIEMLVGRIKFTVIYILSGIGASLASAYYNMYMDEVVLSAGASGAVYGILGLLVAVAIKERNAGGYIVSGNIGIVAVLLVLDGITDEGIDWMAHLGGLVVGLALGMLIYKIIKDRRKPINR